VCGKVLSAFSSWLAEYQGIREYEEYGEYQQKDLPIGIGSKLPSSSVVSAVVATKVVPGRKLPIGYACLKYYIFC